MSVGRLLVHKTDMGDVRLESVMRSRADVKAARLCVGSCGPLIQRAALFILRQHESLLMIYALTIGDNVIALTNNKNNLDRIRADPDFSNVEIRWATPTEAERFRNMQAAQ